MSHEPPDPSFRVTRIGVEGPPDPTLVFEGVIRHSLPGALVILGGHLRVRIGNRTNATGDLLWLGQAGEATASLIPGKDYAGGEIRVPMTPRHISSIEEFRTKEVDYDISGQLFVADLSGDEPPRLERPRQTWLQQVKGTIPQSEWLDYLPQLGWDETELIEVPGARAQRSHPRPWARWDNAVGHFRDGDWNEVLFSCRRVFESLAWEKTPDESKRPDMKALREYFDAGEKGDGYNSILESFGDLLHLGRHEQGDASGVVVKKPDALFALMVTRAFLQAVSK